jgi:hypothetical protein
MKFNPFDGVQEGDWALIDGVAARARHANARKACFICDLLGGVYISGHASRPRTVARRMAPDLSVPSLRRYDGAKKWIAEYLNVSNSFLRKQANATSGSVTVDGKTVVVISEAPDTWIRETYCVESHDHFTYGMDLSNDGGCSWSTRQIEISFSRKE